MFQVKRARRQGVSKKMKGVERREQALIEVFGRLSLRSQNLHVHVDELEIQLELVQV